MAKGLAMMGSSLAEGSATTTWQPSSNAETPDSWFQLMQEAARILHGPVAIEEKLDWIIGVSRRITGAGEVAYAEPTAEGAFRLVAGDASLAAVVAGLAGWVANVFGVQDAVRMEKFGSPNAPTPTSGTPTSGTRMGGDRMDGISSLLVVPVRLSDGGIHGVLLVADAAPSRLDGGGEAGVVMLGAHLAAALDNRLAIRELTELEAARRETVLQLQEAVRPRLPDIEGVEFGVHYLASEPGALTGGDFYDVQVLPNGDLHLVVVDVMGKGVAAAKNALAIAHVLRVLAMEGCPLEQLVSQADQLFRGEGPELVATVLVASYRPSTGHVRFAGGGHPPPVLVRASGKAELVEAPGTPIGWPGAGSDGAVDAELGRSDAIILYTDGLVEARRDIVEGLDVLREAASATIEYPAPYLARAVVDRTLMGADRKDDCLALVLRRRAAPPATGVHHLGPFEYRFAPNPAAATLARHFLSDWLDRQPVDPAAVGDLLLVASELCTNAMQAAQDRGSQVVLRVAAEGDSIAIDVENDGGGFAWQRRAGPPDPDMESGRGLFLVEALTDELTVRQDPSRTIVRCLKRYVVAQPPGS